MSQYDPILTTMANCVWRSADEIQADLPKHYTTSAITARLRELRRRGYDVQCRKREGSPDVYEYMIAPKLDVDTWARDLLDKI